jgi:hypothetical protein
LRGASSKSAETCGGVSQGIADRVAMTTGVPNPFRYTETSETSETDRKHASQSYDRSSRERPRSGFAEPTSLQALSSSRKSGCGEELLWHAHAVTLPLKNHGLRVRGSFPA